MQYNISNWVSLNSTLKKKKLLYRTKDVLSNFQKNIQIFLHYAVVECMAFEMCSVSNTSVLVMSVTAISGNVSTVLCTCKQMHKYEPNKITELFYKNSSSHISSINSDIKMTFSLCYDE